jgi:hypothetical protein
MPIIRFTPADVLKAKTLEAGWYGSEIIKIDSASTTTDKGSSINYIFTFLIENSEGKEIERYFNSKAVGMMCPLIAAATGKIVKPENFDFDTDELLHKKVDSKLDVEIYQGRPQNKINEWVAYGKGKQLQPF